MDGTDRGRGGALRARGLSRRRDGVPTVRWRRGVPDHIRALDTLTDPDYTDVFTASAEGATETPPDHWARALVEGGPARVRRIAGLANAVQRVVLRMRVERRRSWDTLLGWTVTGRGDGWVRLEASSPLMTAHLVGTVDDRQVCFATFVRYERWIARLIWPPVSLLHRWVGMELLRNAT